MELPVLTIGQYSIVYNALSLTIAAMGEAVVGEFVSSRGLGYLMTFALSTYNTAQVVALVLLIGTFVLLFYLAGRLEGAGAAEF